MKQNITIKLNAWIFCALLVLTNLITVAMWQPWINKSISGRTVSVTGTTTIETEPDQYIFSPYYQKQGTDKTVVNTELSELSKTLTTKLKGLGVSDSAIKTEVSSYDYAIYDTNQESNITGSLNLTVTIKEKNMAQKVQDYLATTLPSGSLTPQVSFSVAQQKKLETRARTEAILDAKTKAETSAKQLGVNIGKVISINDDTSNTYRPFPWIQYSEDSAISSKEVSSYSVQPGQNEYSLSIKVTYELN